MPGETTSHNWLFIGCSTYHHCRMKDYGKNWTLVMLATIFIWWRSVYVAHVVATWPDCICLDTKFISSM